MTLEEAEKIVREHLRKVGVKLTDEQIKQRAKSLMERSKE